jgi:mycothiol synthase
VENVTRRAYRGDDVAALTEFFVEMTVAAGGDPGLTQDSVSSWFSSGLVGDPAADTRLVLADGKLVAAALVATPAEGGCLVEVFGGVLPAWRGRGLGRELLGWQIERARELHAATAPDAPWELDTDAYSPEKAAFRLYERFGLKAVRHWHEMCLTLDARAAVPLPDGLRVVPFTEDLAAPLYGAYCEAMADHFGFEQRDFESWAELAIRIGDFRPDLTRIALDGDQVAAYVMVADEPDSRVRLDGVGTRRPWRGRGLATALVSHVLAAAAANGKTRATLAVDSRSPTGAVGIYERAGFEVVSGWVSYRRRLDS